MIEKNEDIVILQKLSEGSNEPLKGIKNCCHFARIHSQGPIILTETQTGWVKKITKSQAQLSTDYTKIWSSLILDGKNQLSHEVMGGLWHFWHDPFLERPPGNQTWQCHKSSHLVR